MTRYLVDANGLVDWLKGRAAATEFFERLLLAEHTLALNAVCVAELYAGLAEDETRPADRMVEVLEYWEIDRRSAQLAGSYRYKYLREGRPLAVPDTLLAAHAVTRDATLITNNVKDFPMPELKLLQPPR